MAFVFKGAGVALVTPFIEDRVNLDLMGRLIDRQLLAGIDALVVLGTTGEPCTMTEKEKAETAAFCVRRAGDVPVIIGVGGNCTSSAADTAKRMQDAGARAVMAVTPYYNRATQCGLIKHFTAIADAVSVPVMLYNVPSRTGVNMLPETVNAMKKHPGICALKEASESIKQVSRVIELVSDDMDVFSGNDEMTLTSMAAGAAGVVSVAANVDPWSVKALTDYFEKGDIDLARAIQSRVTHLSQALFSEVSPIPCKAALEQMGFPVGVSRLPLTEASDSCKALVAKTLRELGLTKG